MHKHVFEPATAGPRVKPGITRIRLRGAAPGSRSRRRAAGSTGRGTSRGRSTRSAWRAALDHPAAVEDQDLVERVQAVQPVGDEDDGAGRAGGDQCGGQHLVGGGGVEPLGRLVEHEHVRAQEQRPGQRESLPLAAGELAAVLADHGVPAGRLGPHPVEEARGGGRDRQVVVVRVRAGEQQVVADGGMEDVGLGEQAADAVRVAAAGRDAAGGARSRRQGGDERGLAGAAGADDRDPVAGRQAQVDAVEGGRGAGPVVDTDVREAGYVVRRARPVGRPARGVVPLAVALAWSRAVVVPFAVAAGPRRGLGLADWRRRRARCWRRRVAGAAAGVAIAGVGAGSSSAATRRRPPRMAVRWRAAPTRLSATSTAASVPTASTPTSTPSTSARSATTTTAAAVAPETSTPRPSTAQPTAASRRSSRASSRAWPAARDSAAPVAPKAASSAAPAVRSTASTGQGAPQRRHPVGRTPGQPPPPPPAAPRRRRTSPAASASAAAGEMAAAPMTASTATSAGRGGRYDAPGAAGPARRPHRTPAG